MASIKTQGSFANNVQTTEQKQLKKYKITITIVAVVLILVVGMTAISDGKEH